jgi:hypothetical protein
MPDAIPLPPEAVEYFVGLARAWVREQRDLHRPLGQPLPDATKVLMAPFFPSGTIDGVRWRVVPAIDNPLFLADAAALGIGLDFSHMNGIAFDDTFLVTQAALQGEDPDALAFHEMVHVVQYGVVGVDEFISQYVTGYLASGEYYTIPLELVAYALQMKWMLYPDDVFSVEDLVQRTIGLRKL